MGAQIRLGLFLLASLLLHVALLMLPVRESRMGGAAGWFASTPALQVRLSSPVDEEPHILPEPVHSLRSYLDQGRAREAEGGEKELESGFPAVFGYEAPEIVSEMPRMISDLKASGIVIIRLAINDVGQVESADIVYSNLPLEVSGKLLLLFSQARFRPAHNGGKAVADSILIQVDVD